MPNKRDPSQRLNDFARAMRREPSEAERVLWHHLRDRQLGGFKFRRQVPIRGRIADFACIEKMLIVEADGEQHFQDEGEKLDAHRDADLSRVGWRTIRFTWIDVLRNTRGVFEAILDALNECPSPPPPPASGRGR